MAEFKPFETYHDALMEMIIRRGAFIETPCPQGSYPHYARGFPCNPIIIRVDGGHAIRCADRLYGADNTNKRIGRAGVSRRRHNHG